MNRNLTPLAWIAVAAVVAAGAFFAGRALNQAPQQAVAFDFEAAPYQAPPMIAGVSKGGFSGFGESAGLEGQTIVAGRIVEVTDTAVTVEASSGQRATVRLSGPAPFRRLEASNRQSLRPGQTVVVRKQPGSDAGAAVLILSQP